MGKQRTLAADTVVTCPHCGGTALIEALNCAIFRHGIFKRTGQQIPPHASKADCDKWSERGELHGCGKPFRVVADVSGGGGGWTAVICDYV